MLPAEIAPGLFRWTAPHPDWNPRAERDNAEDWRRLVGRFLPVSCRSPCAGGLPQVEPGMPVPAGTGMDRRTFLLRSAGAALSVYGASMLGLRHFEEGIAEAAAAAPNQPVLVSIFMEGGWDALSVLAPVKDPQYYKLRPTLGLTEGSGQTFSEDPRLMWYPSSAGLAKFHGPWSRRSPGRSTWVAHGAAGPTRSQEAPA